MSDPFMLTMTEQIAVSAELQRLARNLEAELTCIAGKKVGFCLLTIGGHRVQYVSNCLREDVKVMLAELLAQWEMDDGPLHKAN